MAKRLYRSRQSNVIAGVCGGLGEYFNIDPVIIRVLAVVLLFVSGIGLVAYIVAWIAMPKSPDNVVVVTQPEAQPEPSPMRSYLPGIILVGLGVIFLLNNLIWWFRWRHIWPIVLIFIGLILIWKPLSEKFHRGGAHESVEN